MAEKVFEFLTRIGFTPDDIVEFYRVEPDGFYSDGHAFYGNDDSYAIIQNEKVTVDWRNDRLIEAYWEQAWISEHYGFRRGNYDTYKGRLYKVFQSRYKLSDFKFTKSLRRVLKKNTDLKIIIRPLQVTVEKEELFDIHHRLQLGEPPRRPLFENQKYISDGSLKIMELCVFKDGELVACSIFEETAGALFSNLAFWNLSEAARSLGTLTLLLEVQYALSKQMQYYYFGIFYAQNPTYHYKTRFGGLELYDWDNERWVSFGHPRIKEMLKQKLPRRKINIP